MSKALVVNLFGVPGAGKSTGAAYLFYKLKTYGVNAELVTEFAKDEVWEENHTAFMNQAYLFGEQSYRISRCADKVDVIVTDSPLPLSILYNSDPTLSEPFYKTVMDVFNSYKNLSFLLHRVKEYNPIGRHQTEEESNQLYEPIKTILSKYDIDYIDDIPGCEDGYNQMFEMVISKLNEIKEGDE